jgi:hypothetical protein
MSALALTSRSTTLLALEIRGSNIPINRWSLLAGLLGAVLVVAVSRGVSRRTGWRPIPTMAALLGLVMAFALTLTVNGGGLDSVAACLPDGIDEIRRAFDRVGSGLENLLNVAMLMPFALATVLATRRVVVPGLVVLALPGFIELAQTFVPGRQCSSVDYLANVLGGLLAVGVGALLERRPAVRDWLDSHEPYWPVRRIDR